MSRGGPGGAGPVGPISTPGPAQLPEPRARPPAERTIRIGIDTGGTFTDVVALDERTGALVATKTPSTPQDPTEGFMTALTRALALLRPRDTDTVDVLGVGGVVGNGDAADPRRPQTTGTEPVAWIGHGTTVATNQLLEERLDGLGLITTEGYEFILEIARQSVPDGYGNSYFWVKPPRIVPAHRVRGVAGRLDHRGRELRPFDETAATAVARWFRDRGVDTLGVCFLHSYANPDHELAMLAVLQREHPEAVVSLSSQVLREYREYERSVTTLVDAAVKPRVAAYVGGIARQLDRHAPGVPFSIMKSNGGVLSAAQVVHQPITTVLSGPAAGALGAAFVAAAAGHPAVLTLDGGGTSTDVAVVLDGEPARTTEGRVGRFPATIPMIDVVTVGAGGGSVAWRTVEGALRVGPRSTGADPGPLCYGRGGTEPTVTDAHTVLGRIPPHLLGGAVRLDVDAARAGLTALAADLGLSAERTATGILEISAWNQANAIRQVTVARGLDVRDFTMVAFGGSGPLLICRLIDILGLAGVLVPDSPGTLSAFGLLTVDVRNDHVRTVVTPGAALDPAAVAACYAELEDEASAALRREGFGAGEQRLIRSADLRYTGQAFEVRVPAPAGEPDAAFAAQVVAAFHDEHERLYGYSYRDRADEHPVEWVNLRVSGVGPIRRPPLRVRPPRAGDARRALTGTRAVFFDEWVDTPIYDRAALAPGDELVGPVVVEEFGSTIPIHPGFVAHVDPHGNLLVQKVTTARFSDAYGEGESG